MQRLGPSHLQLVIHQGQRRHTFLVVPDGRYVFQAGTWLAYGDACFFEALIKTSIALLHSFKFSLHQVLLPLYLLEFFFDLLNNFPLLFDFFSEGRYNSNLISLSFIVGTIL